MSTVYKYRTFCLTENIYVYNWGLEAPTNCTNNVEHEIDPDQIVVIDSISSNSVDINQETIDTGGHYRTQAGIICAEPMQTTSQVLSWPYTITVMNFSLCTDENSDNCVIEAISAENTIIGALIQNANISDTSIYVSPTVIENIHVGFQVSIFDGVSSIKVGECILKGSNYITLSAPLPQNFSAGQYVQMSVAIVKDFHVMANCSYDLARKTVKGSTIFPGVSITVRSTNNSTAGNCSCIQYTYEYLY